MEYLNQVKKFLLIGYAEVSPDMVAVEEKLENFVLKEKHSACQTSLTDYFDFEQMPHVCKLSVCFFSDA